MEPISNGMEENLPGEVPSQRQEKVNERLRRLAADFLELESNKTSLITVTRADASKDLKRATLFITVLPESREEGALLFARRKSGEFRDYVKSKMKMRSVPFFTFEIDKGEKTRRKIDEL